MFDASWIRFAPLSLLGLISIGVLAAALGQFREAIDYRALIGSGPVQSLLAWAGGVPPAVVVLNTILSTVLYVLFYGGFRLVRQDDGALRIGYGLLTQRSVTIEEARIRGVRLDEPLLLRLGGGARAKVVAAGLGVKDSQGNEKRDSDLLLPSVPFALAHRVTAAVPGVSPSPVAVPGPRAPRVGAAGAAGAVGAGLGAPGGGPRGARGAGGVPALAVAARAPARARRRRVRGAGVPQPRAREGRRVPRRARGIGDPAHGRGALRRHHRAWRFRRTVFQRRPRLLSASATVAAGRGAHTISYADQDEVLALTAAAVPGLLTPFLEPDPG